MSKECDTKWLPRPRKQKSGKRASKHRIKAFFLRAQNFECFYCEELINYDEGTRDHFFPKIDGYILELNTVIACDQCNVAKGHIRPSIDFIDKAVALYEAVGLMLDPHKNEKHIQQTDSQQKWEKLIESISDMGLIGVQNAST